MIILSKPLNGPTSTISPWLIIVLCFKRQNLDIMHRAVQQGGPYFWQVGLDFKAGRKTPKLPLAVALKAAALSSMNKYFI